VLALRKPQETLPFNPSPLLKGEGEGGDQAVTVRMQLIGANPKPETTGLDALPSKVNYFRGKDSKHWRTYIPTYARVKYAQVYPGVDLVYYGRQRQLEYDFVIAPGVDPGVIRLALSGAEKVGIEAQGDVVLSAMGGEVRLRKPDIYQEINGKRRKIEGRFVQYDRERSGKPELTGDTQIGFQVAAYDKTKPLIIDPEVVYSTYLGGGGGEQGRDIVVDGAGNAYVTGVTQSLDFPTVPVIPPILLGEGDAFVTKFSPTGEVLFSTYLGGNGEESGSGITVDGAVTSM
jgi:beta-propeller repeat-containing protein